MSTEFAVVCQRINGPNRPTYPQSKTARHASEKTTIELKASRFILSVLARRSRDVCAPTLPVSTAILSAFSLHFPTAGQSEGTPERRPTFSRIPAIVSKLLMLDYPKTPGPSGRR
jgi:hypothetical protein